MQQRATCTHTRFSNVKLEHKLLIELCKVLGTPVIGVQLNTSTSGQNQHVFMMQGVVLDQAQPNLPTQTTAPQLCSI